MIQTVKTMRTHGAFLFAFALFFACTGGGGAKFYGQVNAPDGAVDSAEVLVMDSSQKVVDRVLTSSSGKFGVKAKLAPGAYQIEIKKLGYQTYKKTISYPETSSLTVNMVVQLTVKGLVRLPDQSVASQAIVTFKKQGSDQKLKAVSDEGGHYMVQGLDAGEYSVEINSPDGLHALDIDKFMLAESQKVVEKEFVLQPAKGRVEQVEGEVQKSTVIIDKDTPLQN